MVRSLKFNTKKERNAYIIGQTHANETAENIGAKVGLSGRQVKRIRKAHRHRGRFSRRKGSGRRSVLTATDKRQLRDAVTRTPCVLLHTIIRNLNLPCSVRTARTYLKSIGWSYKRTRSRPHLSRKNVQDRLSFAETYVDHDFSNAIFIDESVFQVGQPGYGWSRKGHEIPRSTYHTPPTASVWGAISAEGKLNITFYNGTLDRWSYSDLIEEHLYDQADEVFGDGDWLLVQDGAPPHRAIFTRNNIEERGELIQGWPGSSPDLNPIENLWHLLKQRVYRRNPQTQEELEQFIMEEWDDLSDETVRNLANSMARRLEMVIERNGYHTRY